MESPKNIPVDLEESEINVAEGLNSWNDRLDKNLESNDQNDVNADERAKNFSENEGNGKSDEAKSS